MNRNSVILLVILVVVVLAALLLVQRGGQTPAVPAPAPTLAPTALPPTTAASANVPAATAAATVAPATAEPTPTPEPTLSPDQFANPVLDRDFPDPDTLKVGDTWYAYATNSGSTNIQMAMSKDLAHWQMVFQDALPVLPEWSKPGGTWAPEVTTTADGKGYVMYYAARHKESGRECIGVATSKAPDDPFRSTSDKPFICQLDLGGDIDPASFADSDGTRYVLWKNDGNCCGVDTWLWIQKVSGDGLQLQGEPMKLIKEDQLWEGNVVEAPTLWKHGSKYYLLYSANAYNTLKYAVGWAVADNILGPYKKSEEPLLQSDLKAGAAFGPGGQDITVDQDGETWIVYHSWNTGISYRMMDIDPLTWQGDKPVVKGPTKGPQLVPAKEHH